MGDMTFGRNWPRLRNVSELFCVTISVSPWVLVYPFPQNKERARESGYQLKAGVHGLHDLG